MYLWEVSMKDCLMEHFCQPKEDVEVLYQPLLSCYEKLLQEAVSCLVAVNKANFESSYNRLMKIDSKCRFLLHGILYSIEEPKNQFKFIDIVQKADIELNHEWFYKRQLKSP